MADITYADKIAASTFSHENANEIKTAVNTKVDKVTGERLINAAEISKLATLTDEIIEVANYAALPVTGTAGILYVALDTGYLYRWTGSVYSEVSAGVSLGETSTTAYRGDRGATAYSHSQDSAPHVTAQNKTDLGIVTRPTTGTLVTGSNEIDLTNAYGKYYNTYDMASGAMTITIAALVAANLGCYANGKIIADGSTTPVFSGITLFKGTYDGTNDVVNKWFVGVDLDSSNALVAYLEWKQAD